VSRRAGTVAGLAASAAALTLAGVVLAASETRFPETSTRERLLYLRSGETADRLMLTFDALAADVYWIRAIQHYGRDRKARLASRRFELLQPLLDLATTLDPLFNVAYRFGAVFLSIPQPDGPGRADQAIALLRKGLDRNPTRWQFAHDIGFVHYFYTLDYGEAARWFRAAADMPGAPLWLGSLAATTAVQGRDLGAAETMFAELARSEQGFIRQAAERGLSQVAALRAIDALDATIARFHDRTGRYPTGWPDLINAGLLRGVPLDPTGVPFAYHPATHVVSLAPGSSLLPLPALTR
jgi:hypothetical protein